MQHYVLVSRKETLSFVSRKGRNASSVVGFVASKVKQPSEARWRERLKEGLQQWEKCSIDRFLVEGPVEGGKKKQDLSVHVVYV